MLEEILHLRKMIDRRHGKKVVRKQPGLGRMKIRSSFHKLSDFLSGPFIRLPVGKGGLTPKLYGLVTTKTPSSCFGNLLGSTELYRCAPPLCRGRNVSRS